MALTNTAIDQFPRLLINQQQACSGYKCVAHHFYFSMFKFYSKRITKLQLCRSTAQFDPSLVEKALVMVKTAVTYLKPGLASFWHYAMVELAPPTLAEILTAIWSLKKILNSAQANSFKYLTVKEALLAGLAATEVWMSFRICEIIGKVGIIGYDV
ncbi:ATP synthase subunit g, mitochondrial-like [Elephas maximus indicus]|uniref:ATP synthase subunit g, mitochondrial-like n=1 Tax=Elephas maximus indicus TaxID=99487 RepID=UPI0021161637|nr:ATP synthase subunit g, mitochondrial-like [Elephas maximus indicus]